MSQCVLYLILLNSTSVCSDFIDMSYTELPKSNIMLYSSRWKHASWQNNIQNSNSEIAL